MRRYVRNLRRWMGALTAIALVAAWPALAGADETKIPPEANWTPTPPARQTVDTVQLAELLKEKGVLTDQDYAQLTRPRLSAPPRQGHGRVWTWDEIDRNPVLRIGGSGGD
jgi:hypothetical protein